MSKQQASVDVLEGNKLIAEFMGGKLGRLNLTHKEHYKNLPHGRTILVEDLKYHSSWNWIMPVVSRINHTEVKGKVCTCLDYWDEITRALCGVEIKLIWESVIQFIIWYNTQTKKQ